MLTPEKLEELLRAPGAEKALDRLLCEESLIDFVRVFWPFVEPSQPLVEGWALQAVTEHLEAISRGEILRLMISVPPGFCKAIDCDTPILTTWGWKRHGDLRPGDFVFGPDGEPKRVLAVTAHVREPCYDVHFDDGAKITAGAGHLWAVERDKNYTGSRWARCRKPAVVTTPDLIGAVPFALKSETRPDRISMTAPVQFPPRNFLVDPYLFGVWLGDGDTLSGAITSGEEDVAHFSAF